MEPNDGHVHAQDPDGQGPGSAEFELRRALEDVELEEDAVQEIEREVNEGMRSPAGSRERKYAVELLDWQSTAYSGFKTLDSYLDDLDDRLDFEGNDAERKNLAILAGKVAQKHLPPEAIENRIEYLFLFMLAMRYGFPIGKLYLNQNTQNDDE
jgi:hypothetical protein